MTPELAAEKAADMLDLATDDVLHGDIVENRIAIADAWMRVHTALANAPKQIEPATPDEHYELGIDKILRRNEELKRAAALAASKPTEPRPDVIKLSNDANRPSVIRLHGTDYEIHGCAFRELGVGRDDVHAMVELQLVKKF